jgi:hypothetical protein
MACVFREMLSILKLRDSRHIEATRRMVLGANPLQTIANESMKNPVASGRRLSYRDTSQPENGSPISELTGMKRRIVPSSASL